MAFMDKIGKVANKIGETATDAAELGKAKGSLVLEKGKLNDAYERYGEYMYRVNVLGEAMDNEKASTYAKLIKLHLDEIESLEREAADAKNEFKKNF